MCLSSPLTLNIPVLQLVSNKEIEVHTKKGELPEVQKSKQQTVSALLLVQLLV